MRLEDTNARELGSRLGALVVGEIDASLDVSKGSAVSNVAAIREATLPYAEFFGIGTDLRDLGGPEPTSVLQSGFSLYHESATRIRVRHGENTSKVFRTAFLATFYVRARNAGMPPSVAAMVESELRQTAHAISDGVNVEKFLQDPSAEGLFVFVDQLGMPGSSEAGPAKPVTSTDSTDTSSWHVFISHASEDKEECVRPLAIRLRERGMRVWFDEFALRIGDSLRRSIDRGLVNSKYGVVVISPNFLKKEWPQRELDGLTSLETEGRKVILPVWHNVDAGVVRRYSPILADRVAASTHNGLEKVVDLLVEAMV